MMYPYRYRFFKGISGIFTNNYLRLIGDRNALQTRGKIGARCYLGKPTYLLW